MAKKKIVRRKGVNPFSSIKKKTTKPKRKAKPKAKRKITPSWLMDRDGITNSGLQCWMECREQFSRRYVEGWTSNKISVPLVYGSLWHLAHEHRQSKKPWHGVDAYLATSKKHLTDYAYKDLQLLARIVKTVFPYYVKHYRASDKGIKFINHEATFSIPFQVEGETLHIRGKRDGEYRVRKSLGLWEIKTKAVLDQYKISNLLRCDFQTLLYLWSMWKEYDEAPSHLTYDVVKRPGHRRKTNENLEQFLRRIEFDVKRNPSSFFMRWPVVIAKSDLLNFEKNILTPVASEFVLWNREVSKTPFLPERLQCQRHYTNLSALTTSYGQSDLYDLMVLGRTENYHQRSCPHPELEDPDNLG